MQQSTTLTTQSATVNLLQSHPLDENEKLFIQQQVSTADASTPFQATQTSPQPATTTPISHSQFEWPGTRLFGSSYPTCRSFYGDETWNILKPYVIGCGSAMFVQFFTQPLLNLKTIDQISDPHQYTLNKAQYFKKCRYFFSYLRTFGLLNLWRGFPTAFQAQFIANFGHLYYLHHTQEKPVPLSLNQAITTTLLAVLISASLYSPFDNIITKQQSDVLLPSQYQTRYKSMYHAIPHIFRREGLSGLFRGASITIPKQLAHTATLFTAYPHVLDQFPKKNQPTKLLSYIVVALSSSIIYHPFDTMKTLIQATPYEARLEERFNSNWKILKNHVQMNGMRSLYRGLMINSVVTTCVPLATYFVVDLIARSQIMK